MKVIIPITITDAMLVGSSVIEVPPAAFNAGVSYPGSATVSVPAGTALAVYESLQAGNVGHPPASSPAWWRHIGDTYAVYDPNATYGLGSRVIDPSAHLVYESQKDANQGQTLTTGTAWLKVPGVTNKWSAFDRLRSTQTVAPVDIVKSIAPGQRVGAIAIIGLDAASVTVTVTVAGIEKYRRTEMLKLRRSYGWRDYFFGRFSYRKSVLLQGLPPYRNAVITVTVSKAAGQRGVGGIVVGNAVYIGDMQWKPRSDHLNFSEVDRDKFGTIDLVPRRSVPKLNGEVWFDKSLTRRILELREELNGVPAVWSGLDDHTVDYFEPLFIYGIHKEFSVSLEDAKHGTITLEVEEL